MSELVISVEDIYKQYRLGAIGTGTLSHDLNRWWHSLLGKPDPYMKVTTENQKDDKEGSDYVWALQQINFEVKQGEILGIIGKNGAGKSTLLKILSKITGPTKGNVKVKGRIASLLEVGTGFHPELTGRENIYQNGAILGMTKREISSKFDEIVDFAGIAKYIDTPVKRYSSGMYVRLAFGVAAHLEPEILIIDEVLAVGDAEFQKKCLGKMKSVSDKDGRTVLFVSHNMSAIQSLCSSAILLKDGRLIQSGSASQMVRAYLSHYSDHTLEKVWDTDTAPANEFARLQRITIIPASSDEIIRMGESFEMEFQLELFVDDMDKVNFTLYLYDEMGNMVFDTNTNETLKSMADNGRGSFIWRCRIPENLMNEGTYNIGRILIIKNFGSILFQATDLLRFDIVNTLVQSGWMGQKQGVVRPKLLWSLRKDIPEKNSVNSRQ